MNRENLTFLIGGLAFGALFGFGLFYVIEHRPAPVDPAAAMAGAPAPAGPMAPTQVGSAAGSSAAPMMEEIAALKGRLAEDPNDGAALTRLAHLYHDASMWKQAVDYYERALEVFPGDPNLMTDLGVCYQGLAEFDRALELFEGAHATDSGHWQSLYNIVVVAGFNLGDLERAQDAYDELQRVQPTPPGLERLGELLERARAIRDGEGAS